MSCCNFSIPSVSSLVAPYESTVPYVTSHECLSIMKLIQNAASSNPRLTLIAIINVTLLNKYLKKVTKYVNAVFMLLKDYF